MALEEVIQSLAAFGLFDVVLPFLLVFAISYGIFERSMPFGTKKKNIHAMLAFVLGFLAVASVQVVPALQTLTAYFGIAVVALVLVLLILGIMSKDLSKSKIAFWTALGLFVVIMLAGIAQLIDLSKYIMLLPVLGLIAILAYVFRPTGKETQKSGRTTSAEGHQTVSDTD